MKAGAEQGQTPSDVVLGADITFSCVADPQAAKEASIIDFFSLHYRETKPKQGIGAASEYAYYFIVHY